MSVILGILVLLVCIVLFVPIRYEIAGKCDGNPDTLKIKGTAAWLLHLLQVDIYFKNNTLKWRVRAAWKEMTGGQQKADEAEPSKMRMEKKEEKKTGEEKREENKKEKEDEKEKKERNENQSQRAQEDLESKEEIPEKSEKSSEEPEVIREDVQKTQSIFHKIKELLRKKEKLKELLTNEIHVNAFKKLKKEVFRFLRKLKPKKLYADILFGFDDPCTTGQVLAGLAVFYPVFAEHVTITPEFEKQILKGTIYIKGNIRLGTVAVFLWNLVWSRNIRTTYKDIKSFEL